MAGNLSSLPDTNVILRYLLKDDAVRFAEAELFFEGVRTGKEKVIILETVLVECVYVLIGNSGQPIFLPSREYFVK